VSRYRLASADAPDLQASREGIVRAHLRRLDGRLAGSLGHERVARFIPERMDR
jgi:hypothetical protein